MTPLVTIGIPTIGRPELLARALDAIAAQDYQPLEAIVSDNASPTHETRLVVERYRKSRVPLTYYRQETRLEPVANFLFLLERANGKYFMWLADDDEITPNYVSELVGVLEADDQAVSAAGHWYLMSDELNGRPMKTSNYPQRWAIVRVLRFIWRTDDAFFYGLHRTAVLRLASFRGYWRPNRDVPINWAFVFLMDVVLRGTVLLAGDRTVRFINHDYTPKSYPRRPSGGRSLISLVVRRINCHVLFWEKCARVLSPVWMPLVIATSLLSLMREAASKALHAARSN